ncbi:hypothetical protein Peur_005606 [Populus x canadensis]
MGLSRFSDFLSRTPKRIPLLYSSSLNLEPIVLRSLINIKNQTLSLHSTPNIESPCGSLLKPHFIVHRSIHGDLQ